MTSVTERFAALNLSEEEIKSYQKKFQTFDLDKDGVISTIEFAAVSKVCGFKLSREEILTIFGKKDLDKAGVLTFEEFVVVMRERGDKMRRHGGQSGQYRDAFRLYDTKRRGFVTADEAIPILRYQLGFDENKTEKLVEMYDKNKDYSLSLPEFIPFYQRVQKLKSVLDDAFNEFDKDKDGYISLEELSQMLSKRGFTQEDILHIFNKYDKDGDGRLNFQEFAVFWNLPV